MNIDRQPTVVGCCNPVLPTKIYYKAMLAGLIVEMRGPQSLPHVARQTTYNRTPHEANEHLHEITANSLTRKDELMDRLAETRT